MSSFFPYSPTATAEEKVEICKAAINAYYEELLAFVAENKQRFFN